ncbi:Heat shock cognate 70 kDa protein 1 [Hordeum vulgare]|nr:Heat shock cognate 70 kDa protein 1 [Hordeum vulgare]
MHGSELQPKDIQIRCKPEINTGVLHEHHALGVFKITLLPDPVFSYTIASLAVEHSHNLLEAPAVCSGNRLLRLSLWAAYLGADLAAVYALGYLSRHQDNNIERLRRTEQLAFFWAPFLLVHLGGQDTITAFAMEDNNLWLRHLLNLLTQIALALYVFRKSIGRHSANLLLSGIFAFIAGIIKYGERIWSLKCARLKSLESSTGQQSRKQLPEGITGAAGFVGAALNSMPRALDVLLERSMIDPSSDELVKTEVDSDEMIKTVRLQLGIIYDDLYTKALVLRTWSGVILRCISLASVIAAFALFHPDDKQRYSKADIAITYALFVGCFFLEVCSMFISLMSSWTWAWLKVQNCDVLARLSWFLFCCDIGYPRMKQRWPNLIGQYNFQLGMKQRWPNLIGQYNFHGWLTDSDVHRSTCDRQIMVVFRKLFVGLLSVNKKKMFWISNLLDTKYTDVDEMIVKCVAKGLSLLLHEFDDGQARQEWPNISPLFGNAQDGIIRDFGYGIVFMHYVTETLLEKPASPSEDMEANATGADVPSGLVEVCRKLSNYMMYLLVTNPSMLPLSISATATLDHFQEPERLKHVTKLMEDFELEATKETLEEVARLWVRLLLYTAGKSKAEMHAAQLSEGGELITFAWLLMAHRGIGDYHLRRILLTNGNTRGADAELTNVYAFYVP